MKTVLLSTASPVGHSEPAYVWHVPGKQISIHLSARAIQQLLTLLDAAPAALDGRVVEAGGILLGRSQSNADEHTLVLVDSVETFASEHLRGASFLLSSHEKLRLHRQLKASGEEAVGFFRLHSRPGLFLDQYDWELMRMFFHHPDQVALLVRPETKGAPEAGFFFWEDGDIQRTRTYAAFPLTRTAPVQVSAPPPSPIAKTLTFVRKAGLPGRSGIRNFWAPLVGAAAITCTAALVLTTHPWAPRRSERPRHQLSLSAESVEGRVRLTWNPASPLLERSHSATLVVSDGPWEKRIVLNEKQLENGEFSYRPESAEVNFRLEVAGWTESAKLPVQPPATGTLPTQTEVQGAGQSLPAETAGSAPPPAATLPAGTPPLPTAPGETELAKTARADVAQSKPAALKPQTVSAADPSGKSGTRSRTVRPMAAEALTPRRVPQTRSLETFDSAPEIATAPSFGSAPSHRHAPPEPVTFAVVEPVRPSFLRKALGAIPGVGLLHRRKPQDSDDFVPAQAVRRVNPVLPKTELGAQAISVKLSIDDAGNVETVEVVGKRGDAAATEAALQAARKWKFEPAKLHNKSVPSAVVVHFELRGGVGG